MLPQYPLVHMFIGPVCLCGIVSLVFYVFTDSYIVSTSSSTQLPDPREKYLTETCHLKRSAPKCLTLCMLLNCGSLC